MSRMDTWMPLFVADYLADTMGLSAEEHGAYLLLLMDYWRHGPLLDDDKRLSAIARVDRRRWNATIGPAIRSYFTVGSDGRLHQKRIDKERSHAIDLSAKRRIAASRKVSGGKKVGASEAEFPIESMPEDELLQVDSAECQTGGENQPSVTASVQESGLSAAQKSDSSGAQKSMLFPLPKPNNINGPDQAIAPDLHTFCTPFARSLHDPLSRDLLQKEERKKESPPSPPQAGGRRVRGRMPQAPIPDEWKPDQADIAYALEWRQPVDTRGVSEFVDWHKVAGRMTGSVKASWRTWCRNAVKMGRCTPLPQSEMRTAAAQQQELQRMIKNRGL